MYVKVRGIEIPKLQIEVIEQEYGCKLVQDKESVLIYKLDRELEKFRNAHKGKLPKMMYLSDEPGWSYRPMALNITVMGMEIPGPMHKPAWFKWRTPFVPGKTN